jgi:hypothetical protein
VEREEQEVWAQVFGMFTEEDEVMIIKGSTLIYYSRV